MQTLSAGDVFVKQYKHSKQHKHLSNLASFLNSTASGFILGDESDPFNGFLCFCHDLVGGYRHSFLVTTDILRLIRPYCDPRSPWNHHESLSALHASSEVTTAGLMSRQSPSNSQLSRTISQIFIRTKTPWSASSSRLETVPAIGSWYTVYWCSNIFHGKNGGVAACAWSYLTAVI